jgi:uncharacterized protein
MFADRGSRCAAVDGRTASPRARARGAQRSFGREPISARGRRRGVVRAPRGARAKTIFDPVHGPVVLDGASLELVADPAFQRLWGIRQTGLANLVFPGANHTRLEHSLGVYWVAHRIAEALGLPATEHERLRIGGLLHDLGHGPLSHTLDGPMLEVLGVDHEARSRALVLGRVRASDGTALADSRIPAILERCGVGPKAVADLIDPPGRGASISPIGTLLHGAIDADRIDYLQRDAHYTGVAHGAIDAARLLETMTWRGRRLVFAEKGRSAVEGFAVGRALMFSSVYFHKTVRSAEMMAQAAVERMVGYPESARPLFDRTDAELFADLEREGGFSAGLMRALRERRLYKRVRADRSVDGPVRGALTRLARRPSARRAWEDRLAAAVRAPPGHLLVDLTGLVEREPAGRDWARVALLEEERITYPFRGPGLWHEIVARPRNPWALAVYAHPRSAAAAGRLLARRGLFGI